MVKTVTRARLNVALHVQCLSYCLWGYFIITGFVDVTVARPYHTVHFGAEEGEQVGNNSCIYLLKHKKCKKLFSFITTYKSLTVFMFALN